MLSNCGAGEDLRVAWTVRRSNQSVLKESILNIHWKNWCWSWRSNTLATWYEELTHWKRPWCWERLKAGGEGDNRRWHHWLNGHEFEQASGDGEGQGSLACCSPWLSDWIATVGKQRPTDTYVNYTDIYRDRAWDWIWIARAQWEMCKEGNEVKQAEI